MKGDSSKLKTASGENSQTAIDQNSNAGKPGESAFTVDDDEVMMAIDEVDIEEAKSFSSLNLPLDDGGVTISLSVSSDSNSITNEKARKPPPLPSSMTDTSSSKADIKDESTRNEPSAMTAKPTREINSTPLVNTRPPSGGSINGKKAAGGNTTGKPSLSTVTSDDLKKQSPSRRSNEPLGPRHRSHHPANSQQPPMSHMQPRNHSFHPPHYPHQPSMQMLPHQPAHMGHPSGPHHHPPYPHPPHPQYYPSTNEPYPHHAAPPPHHSHYQSSIHHPGQPGGPYNSQTHSHPPYHPHTGPPAGPPPHPSSHMPHHPHPTYHHQQQIPPYHHGNHPYPPPPSYRTGGPQQPQHHHHPQQQQHMGGMHQQQHVPTFSMGSGGRSSGSHSHQPPPSSGPNTLPPPTSSSSGVKTKAGGGSSSTITSSTSRKKRTIDGVREQTHNNTSSSFTMHRSSSNSSTCSTGTVGNNTSTDTGTSLTDDSPQKRDPVTGATSKTHMLPPRSSPFQASNYFNDDVNPQQHQQHHHRRNHSTASTASSLSVGGISMSSYDRGNSKDKDTATDPDDTPMLEASPKRRRAAQHSQSSSDFAQKEAQDKLRSPHKKGYHHHHNHRTSADESPSRHARLISNSSPSVDTTTGTPARFDFLSVNDESPNSMHSSSSSHFRRGQSDNPSRHRAGGSNHPRESSGGPGNMFVTLSTSPINHALGDPGITPVSKNTSNNNSNNAKSSRNDENTETKKSSGVVKEEPASPRKADSTDLDEADERSAFSFRKSSSRDDRSSCSKNEDEMSIVLKASGSGSSRYFSDQQLKRDPTSAFSKPGDSTPFFKRNDSSSFDNGSETPIPPFPGVVSDEHSLNRHLRGQSFTPLPHANSSDGRSSNVNSPTFNPALSAIAPQLSWSIAGDTPPLGDIADWPDEQQKNESVSSPTRQPFHRRDGSNVSQMSTGTMRGSGALSPPSMSFWKDDEASNNSSAFRKSDRPRSNTRGGGEYDSILRLSTLSQDSDDVLGGKTTPLPIFFDQPTGSEERENMSSAARYGSGSRSPTSHNKYDRHDSESKHHRKHSGGAPHSHHHMSAPMGASSSTMSSPSGRGAPFGEPEHIHQMFMSNGPSNKMAKPPTTQSSSSRMVVPLTPSSSWAPDYGRGGGHQHHPRGMSRGMHHHNSRMSSDPISSSSYDQRDDAYTPRSSEYGNGRRDGPPHDYHSPRNMFGSPHHGSGMMPPHGDRVRNLRGRGPPSHHIPPPLHIPPHLSSSHPHALTSPMAAGGSRGMWGGGMPPHHHLNHHPAHSPHHHSMHSMDLTPSKRKCVPLKPPIPSKFQGDMEKMKSAQVPEFTSLVNFPVHMSQKQSMNLPDGMRCCVMCGQACPCSAANKNKKNGGAGKGGKSSDGNNGGGANSNSGSSGNNGVTPLGDSSGSARGSSTTSGGGGGGSYAIIPTQNKGLCTMCDVNVWVVVQSGLEIKWCKGCKNFRPWAAFGDKGLATKCVRCRERQREKYAAQKEEKEKARLSGKTGTSNNANGQTKTSAKTTS